MRKSTAVARIFWVIARARRQGPHAAKGRGIFGSLILAKVAANTRGHSRLLDETGHLPVVQSDRSNILALAADAAKQGRDPWQSELASDEPRPSSIWLQPQLPYRSRREWLQPNPMSLKSLQPPGTDGAKGH